MELKKINSLKNNFYALSLVWKMCPRIIIFLALSKLLYYFGWLFYSAFFMRYVINALQNGSIHDCRGCSYEACLHFAAQSRCFYGGSISDDVLPAIPVYSNIYFDFFTEELENYYIPAHVSWAQAILESTFATGEEPLEERVKIEEEEFFEDEEEEFLEDGEEFFEDDEEEYFFFDE